MALLQEANALKKTPLYERHLSLKAKITDFGGWAMPVYYSGIIAEHRHTRAACGVFDVSHLGEVRVHGKGAFAFLQQRLTNDLAALADGRIQYHLLCDERGFTLDDVLVYRESADDFYVIVNASNVERDFDAFKKYAPDSLSVENKSDATACIAVQGPRSESVLENLFGLKLGALAYYAFRAENVLGRPAWISRSGYTGEDGFEIFTHNDDIAAVWDRLIEAGAGAGILPVGLGARNTLRLEAGNALYGHEITETTTPLEAGLGFAVSFGKGAFIGRDMLIRQKEDGVQRKLVGFKMLEKSVARDGYPVYAGQQRVGKVTSGSYAPTLDMNIGMAYVETALAVPGKMIEIEIHGTRAKAEIVKRPFVPIRHL